MKNNKELPQTTAVNEKPDSRKVVEVEPETTEPGANTPPGVKERRFRQTDLPAHFVERRRHPRRRSHPPT